MVKTSLFNPCICIGINIGRRHGGSDICTTLYLIRSPWAISPKGYLWQRDMICDELQAKPEVGRRVSVTP